MIALNITFFIQLGLFLAFMFAMNKIVLAPILKVMDERERVVKADDESAAADTTQAQGLQSEYASAMAAARRESIVKIERARQHAMSQRADALAAARKKMDAEVLAAHVEAMRQVEQERANAGALAEEIADAMVTRVTVKGRR